ncbi:MAG TPA: DUF58 domain-containing protein [Acidimicrobiia bacterium]|nr:DUF58 domain-containing protein [Acidimicrobiia bacterium]
MARDARAGSAELTRRGWTLTGAASGLLIGSRFVGADPLAALALGSGLVIAFGFVWVSTRRVALTLDRSVYPSRPTVGEEGRVVLRGQTTQASSWLNVTESVDSGRRAARFAVVPLAAGTPVEAGYRIPTAHRGRYVVGPTLVTVTDPCGLVRRTWPVGDTAEIIIRPRVHDLVAPLRGGGGEPDERAAGARVPVVEAFGEFLALREYESGDDPRRVHWPSSARRGELLVRVDEAAAPGRAVILLDTRSTVHDGPSFERAIEMAASVASTLHRSRQPIEVVTTSGETFRRPGASALELVLDNLAVAGVDDEELLRPVVAALRNRLGVGAVIVVTGAPDTAIVDAAAALRGRRVVTLVATAPSSVPTGSIPVVDASRDDFTHQWNRTVRARSRWQPASSRSR